VEAQPVSKIIKINRNIKGWIRRFFIGLSSLKIVTSFKDC
jgi:hypothetical protein